MPPAAMASLVWKADSVCAALAPSPPPPPPFVKMPNGTAPLLRCGSAAAAVAALPAASAVIVFVARDPSGAG